MPNREYEALGSEALRLAERHPAARDWAWVLGLLFALSVVGFWACQPVDSARTPVFAATASSSPAQATRLVAEIELAESVPVETSLDHPDVANAPEVWLSMIDGARSTLDFAEFYASDAEGTASAASPLGPILLAVDRAVTRGVRVRFLADAKFAEKYPATLERLAKAGVDVRRLDLRPHCGGVLHAKYFVVDGTDSFLGSQNFDWRALAHIHEMGVRVRSPEIAGALLDLYETDWQLAAGAASAARVHRHPRAVGIRAASGERIELVASPDQWLPDQGAWDLPRLVTLLDGAKHDVSLQVLNYKTKSRDGQPFLVLDDALRRAASRGVRVRLLVSEWAAKPGSDARRAVDELATVKGVEVRVIVIPAWTGGDVPFARVAHAKYLVVDGTGAAGGIRAWVGTSNWEGDYFYKSRNVGVIVEGGQLPARLARIFEGIWSGAYARPLPP